MRNCTVCGETKSEERFRFARNKKKPEFYRRRTCMDCENVRQQERRAADPSYLERQNSATKRYKYGIGHDEILAAVEAQGGCAICGITDAQWHVDHDHACCSDKYKTCGKCIRGILCRECNLGISYFQDTPESLVSAAEYLTRRQSPI